MENQSMLASEVELAMWNPLSPSERLNVMQEKLLKLITKSASGKSQMNARRYELIQITKDIAGMKLEGGLTMENLKQMEQIEYGTSALKDEVEFQVSEFHARTGHVLEIIVILCILFETWIAFSHS
eukprot:TRINITY_DN22353_c0_g1_i1.p1 TRINITY_DN22353_c0_g1~~TRINITY_DN22353_c0_g1_i1.p1  ORF type:complete len:126 (+),score=21.91 TRINITY_DN22353_c0_g1_i1:55-432(+)